MFLLVMLLTMHFVGDFVMQSDWMAINKSKRWDALAIHVASYVLPFALWLLVRQGGAHGWFNPMSRDEAVPIVAFLGVTLIAHFVTDAITSRLTSKLWFIDLKARPNDPAWFSSGGYLDHTHFAQILDTRHWFFVMIGFDQLLHIWQLAATAYVLGLAG